jgi:8-oxo-dGTP pyrophosphatase MutT (NUDIX family)
VRNKDFALRHGYGAASLVVFNFNPDNGIGFTSVAGALDLEKSETPKGEDEFGRTIWTSLSTLVDPETADVDGDAMLHMAMFHYSLPGGSCRQDEAPDLRKTVLREAEEEIGISLSPRDLINLPETYYCKRFDGGSTHVGFITMYDSRVPFRTNGTLSDDGDELVLGPPQWIPMGEALRLPPLGKHVSPVCYFHESHVRFIAQSIRYLRTEVIGRHDDDLISNAFNQMWDAYAGVIHELLSQLEEREIERQFRRLSQARAEVGRVPRNH